MPTRKKTGWRSPPRPPGRLKAFREFVPAQSAVHFREPYGQRSCCGNQVVISHTKAPATFVAAFDTPSATVEAPSGVESVSVSESAGRMK